MANHQGGSEEKVEPSAHLGSALSSAVCQAQGRFLLCSFFTVSLTFLAIFPTHFPCCSGWPSRSITLPHHFCIFLLALYQLHCSGSPHSTSRCQLSTTLPSNFAYNSTSTRSLLRP